MLKQDVNPLNILCHIPPVSKIRIIASEQARIHTLPLVEILSVSPRLSVLSIAFGQVIHTDPEKQSICILLPGKEISWVFESLNSPFS